MNATKTKVDFARMVIAEVILYPLIICDIFELVLDEPYTLVLFVISTLFLLFYVYVMRLTILAGTIYYTQKERQPQTSQGRPLENNEFDYENSKSAFYFQAYFF